MKIITVLGYRIIELSTIKLTLLWAIILSIIGAVTQENYWSIDYRTDKINFWTFDYRNNKQHCARSGIGNWLIQQLTLVQYDG